MCEAAGTGYRRQGKALATPVRPGIGGAGYAGIVLVMGAALAVVALLLAVTASPARERSAGASAVVGTNGASTPNIWWRPCPRNVGKGGFRCGTVQVPLSYRHPGGKKITLTLGRLPATDQKRKIGTLFWNPGGPGASGLFPVSFSRRLHERFDIVGFDPRGTNASTPLKCFSSNRQAIETFGRPFPATKKQIAPFLAANKRGTSLCKSNAGPIISHMSTANVARDMDLLRRAMGDRKMTYLGFSYGTFLGETYANLFPGKVRAMTLDGVLDPVEWTTGEKPGDGHTQPFTYRLGSFDGSQQALKTFLRECASVGKGKGGCAFAERGAGPDKLLAKYEEILRRLRQGPVEVTDNGQTFKVTYQDAVGITLSLLYSADASPDLARILENLHDATVAAGGRSVRHRAAPKVDLSDVPTRPTFKWPESPAKGQSSYSGLEWLPGVSCLDAANPPTASSWPPYAHRADARAPGFGAFWTYVSTPCAAWPAQDPDRYRGPWGKKTANPLLLIGNRQGDPATPYVDARTTATRRLANARLLTLNSFGHTSSYGGESRCINAAVDRYLVEAKLPPQGKVCQPDRGPFPASP